jgi:uroporphyrinogen-III synthase
VKLIVTRPLGQAAPWVTRLQALGVEAQSLPLIRIEPLCNTAPVREAWGRLLPDVTVVFVSANAVQYFFAAAPDARPGEPPAWPPGVWAASTGPGTTAALLAAGVDRTALVEPPPQAMNYDSEGLWEELQFRPWSGKRVLVVRGEEGRDWLADALRARGAELEFVAAYRRCPPQLDGAGRVLLHEALAEPEAHLWHFSSSEAIGHLRLLGQQHRPPAEWAHSRALASHPRIAQTARDAGFGKVHEVAANVQAVAEWLSDPDASRKKQRRP